MSHHNGDPSIPLAVGAPTPHSRDIVEPGVSIVPREGISLIRIANVLLRHLRLAIGVGAVVALLIVVTGLMQVRTYTAWTSFALERDTPQSAAGGLAAQLGIALPTSQAVETPAFYVEVLKTPALLDSVAARTYTGPGGTGTLEKALGIAIADPRRARAQAVRQLDRAVHAAASPKTGVVTLTVTTVSASLSAQLTRSILDALSRFNLSRRQMRASNSREFIAERLAEGKKQLTAAEDAYEEFHTTNRAMGSPRLDRQEARLQREVSLQTQLYVSLTESFEHAKLDEARLAPAITTIQPPTEPLDPDGRGMIRRGMLAIFAGAAMGALAAFLAEYLAVTRELEPEEFTKFQDLRRSLLPRRRRPA